MAKVKEETSRTGDRPIESQAQDRFGRQPFAELLARQIIALAEEDSHVVGLLGSWGSGKTSIINLAAKVLEDAGIAVVQFNPWLFSTAEQLTSSFFGEVAAQLTEEQGKKWQALGKRLSRYGDALAPLKGIPGVGSYVGAGAEVLKKVGSAATKRGGGLADSVYDQKKQIEEALREAGQRVVIIIDDLDRLEAPEIREIMRLVRLTADFPYVTYLLAFDRERVAQAISSNPGEGEAYLEKIVQLTFDVPQLRAADLRRFFLDELQRVVGERELAPFNETDWQNAYTEVIAPLIRGPRDVRRVMNVLPFALDVAGTEVAPVDLITLETVRVTLPAVFALLPQFADVLTGMEAPKWNRTSQEASPIAPLLEAVPEHRATVQRLCARLFPATRLYIDNHGYSEERQKTWRRERRVANPEVLQFFFQKSLPEDVLSAVEVRHVFDALTARDKLDQLLSPMNGEKLENVLARLEDYEEKLPAEAAQAIPVLYAQAHKLRAGRRQMFDFGADLALSRVVLRIFRRIPEEKRAEIANEIAPKIPTLTGRLDFVRILGSEKGMGHELVPDGVARPLEDALQEQVLAATPESLAKERDPLHIVQWLYGRTRPPDRITTWLRERTKDASFLIALLRSSLNEVMATGMGESAVQRESTLPWDFLEVALSAEGLAQIDALTTKGVDERSALAVDLAKKYRKGWRPSLGKVQDAEKDNPLKRAGWLLFSGIFKQRMEAITLLHQAVIAGTVLPEGVQGQVEQIARNEAYTSDERVAALDLLITANRTDKILGALSEHLVGPKGVGKALASRISKAWSQKAGRLDDLLSVIEALPVSADGKRTATAGVADAYTILCNLIDQDAAAIPRETILRAKQIGATFSGNTPLDQQLKRLDALIEGQGEQV